MKYKVLAITGVLSLFSFLLVPAAVQAHAASNMRSGDTATIAKDETLDASAYLSGSNITVAGTVRGDLYCVGQNINISGTVEGDVLCAGQSITLTGTSRIMGDVRVAGQTINADGPVAHNFTAFGQNVAVTPNAIVNDDATIYGTSVQVNGKIGRDLTGGGQNFTVGGNVGRNAVLDSEKPVLTDGARIGGNLKYTSRNQIELASGATVVGETDRHQPQNMDGEQQNEWVERFWGIAYWLCALLFFGLVLLGIAPRTYKTAYSHMTQRGGWALLAGLLALVLTPIIAVALAVTVIGIPVGVALAMLWVVTLAASFVYSGYSFGAWIAEQASWKLKWPLATSLLIGLVLLSLIMMIPIVGGLITFLALVWGLGGIVLTIGSYIKHRHEPFPAAVAAKTSKKAKA